MRYGSAALLGVLLMSCKSPVTLEEQPLPPEVVETLQRYKRVYVLAPGDQVEILVLRNPDVSRTVVVRPDGFITVPILDEIHAAGLTMKELDDRLTTLLAERLVEPEVSVLPVSIREPLVYVLGEVGQARPVPFRQARTAAEAITHAGGFRPSAEKTCVAIIRLTDDGRLRATKISPILEGQPGPYMALHATMLQPDDIVMVPEKHISEFNRVMSEALTAINLLLGSASSASAVYFNYRLIDDLN